MTPAPIENIDALLEHLPPGTLARELAAALRECDPENWDAMLKEELQARMDEDCETCPQCHGFRALRFRDFVPLVR